jgi:hypothetical protein
MKTLLLITLCALCGCSKPQPEPYPVLRVRDWDPMNNRVDERGNLVPFTNWGIGFFKGTNFIKVMEAREK